MFDTLIVFAFAGVILGIIGYVLYMQLVKFLKGSVYIQIPKTEYVYGEMITGSIEIHAKKDIEVFSTEIILVGSKKERIYARGKPESKSVEIFRQEHELSGKDILHAGTTKTMLFSCEIPKISEFGGELQSMIQQTHNTISSTQRFYRGMKKRGQLRWNIKVNVNAKGVNLYKREGLVIHQPLNEENI